MINKKILLGFLAFIAIFLIRSDHANAATFSVATGNNSVVVDSSCSLSEAIQNINDQAQTNADCNNTGSAFGTNDTINMSAGDITLTSDLPTLIKSITINGAGISSTTISGDNSTYQGFNIINDMNMEVAFTNFKIKDLKSYAINSQDIKSITITNIDQSNSDVGVRIAATSIMVQGSSFYNNLNVGQSAGLVATTSGATTTDNEIVRILNSKFYNNSCQDCAQSGLSVGYNPNALDNSGNITATPDILVQNVNVHHNVSNTMSGLIVSGQGGPTVSLKAKINVNAVTVNNNSVIVTVPVMNPPGLLSLSSQPFITGFVISGSLTVSQNVTNVTVANNSVTMPAGDNRLAIAGFDGALHVDSEKLSIINATVVGNNVNQPDIQQTLGAFFINKVGLSFDNNGVNLTSVTNGSTAINTLIASNKINGVTHNCLADTDLTIEGFGIIDSTPENLGYNLSDNQTCTGFTYIANLYDTIEHEVSDNGGPVPTIKLLEGSPAINAGGQVLGIDTDARGVPRNGYYSVGAYQGSVLNSVSTNNSGGGTLASTGAIAISSFILIGAIIGSMLFIYIDYKAHKKPLLEEDPHVHYTVIHHIKKVTIPVLKYRITLKLDSANSRNVDKF